VLKTHSIRYKKIVEIVFLLSRIVRTTNDQVPDLLFLKGNLTDNHSPWLNSPWKLYGKNFIGMEPVTIPTNGGLASGRAT